MHMSLASSNRTFGDRDTAGERHHIAQCERGTDLQNSILTNDLQTERGTDGFEKEDRHTHHCTKYKVHRVCYKKNPRCVWWTGLQKHCISHLGTGGANQNPSS